MVDVYEEALKKLRADERSCNALERKIGVPAETLRDIKQRIVKNPRYDTLKRIAAFYEREAEEESQSQNEAAAPAERTA